MLHLAKGALHRIPSSASALAAASLLVRIRPAAAVPGVAASKRWHGGPSVSADSPTVNVVFVDTTTSSGDNAPETVTVSARVGETLLQTAHRHKIPVEGACEGVCACSTCHVILPDDLYDSLIDVGKEASEDEEDMLDMAPGLTPTSRLGCQVIVTEEMEGVEIKLPGMTRNFYVDGHVPEPH
mmetsp:Transcript_596/g.1841  ORF Transcript_596/g.1841 Transcript_596/m.1841 type:complete len:183 (-) Transcript_596:561-1109(-)|eukprot:CAMPEP_0113556950 /NCGR_PEP_ID=MMETSP0015_2-20120614/17530_1 /TAXON_ID=2838 /ORGANISM="Odontella" /LENGTH=182 /DNA_ID=CAMNT_0000458341 /DNA_START=213 /DNA_END=761 /DNA_ORIENTATION=+ /assembly_acc=CAM_ASM_000160